MGGPVAMDLTIGRRLAMLTGLTLFIAVVVGVMGVVSLGSVQRNASDLYASSVRPIDSLGRLHDAIGDARSAVWHYVDAASSDRRDAKTAVAATDAQIDGYERDYLAASSDASRRALMAQFQGLWAGWKHVRDAVVFTAADRGDSPAAHAAIGGPLNDAYTAYSDPLDHLVDAENAAAARQAHTASSTYAGARLLLIDRKSVV